MNADTQKEKVRPTQRIFSQTEMGAMSDIVKSLPSLKTIKDKTRATNSLISFLKSMATLRGHYIPKKINLVSVLSIYSFETEAFDYIFYYTSGDKNESVPF